jgi:hypothetical protein
MKLKITSGSLFMKYYLIVDAQGVKFYESAALGSAKRFQFSQIKSVLMAPDHRLSFQVGNEVFSIPTQPDKAKHQAAIDALLLELRRTTTAGI